MVSEPTNEAQATNGSTAEQKASPTTHVLIVAIYNHANYKKLEADGTKDLARDFSRGKIGYRKRHKDTHESLQRVPVDFRENFFYLGSFPYYKIPNDNIDDPNRSNLLYGWVAIIERERWNNFTSSNSYGEGRSDKFLSIYDIQVFDLRQDTMDALLMTTNNLQKEKGAWETRGLDVYDDQTPRMWTPG